VPSIPPAPAPAPESRKVSFPLVRGTAKSIALLMVATTAWFSAPVGSSHGDTLEMSPAPPQLSPVMFSMLVPE
jgi:hypothetical protein